MPKNDRYKFKNVEFRIVEFECYISYNDHKWKKVAKSKKI